MDAGASGVDGARRFVDADVAPSNDAGLVRSSPIERQHSTSSGCAQGSTAPDPFPLSLLCFLLLFIVRRQSLRT